MAYNDSQMVVAGQRVRAMSGSGLRKVAYAVLLALIVAAAAGLLGGAV